MKLPPRFLNYRRVWNGSKFDKVPCDPFGRNVDAHDPKNHLTYEAAAAHATFGDDETKPFGVAFDLVETDNLFFLDFDDCLNADKTWDNETVAIFGSFAGCLGEVSQSGRGLHIIGRCDPSKLKDRRNKFHGNKREFYTGGRFIAFGQTGWNFIGNVTRDHDWTDHLLKIVPQREFLGELPDGVDPAYTGPADDQTLISRMLASTGSAGSAFGMRATVVDLWTADVAKLSKIFPAVDGSGGFDHSSADAALMTHLAFWTGKDMPRMDRLFRLSGLMRPKYAERADYRRDTVQNAARLCRGVYDHKLPVAVDSGAGGAVVLAGHAYMTTAEQIEHFKGYVYISETHRIMAPDGRMLKPEQFNALMGGKIFQMQDNATGPSKKAFEAFTENRAHVFPKVTRPVFDPKQPGGSIIGDGVNTYFKPDIDMTPGDVSRYLGLLEKLLPEKRDRDILLNWIASCVQNPGVKFQWSPVVQGCEGNGKTLLFSCVGYAVGRQYTHQPKSKQVGGQFNKYLEGKIFILIEEVHMRGRHEILDDLKTLITNVEIEVEGKGQDQRMIQNFANWAMCTNHQDAVMKSKNDRRYAIFFTAQQSADDLIRDGMTGNYFPDMYEWLRTGGGYAAVAHYLKTFPLDPALDPAQDCQRAPKTSSTDMAIMKTIGSVESEIIEAAADNTSGFRGGWLSAWALDKLMRDRGFRIGRSKQIEIIESMGYVAFGRAPRIIMFEDQKRPMIYRLPDTTGDFDDFVRVQAYG